MTKSLALVAVLLTFAVLAVGMTLFVSNFSTAYASSVVRLDQLPSEVHIWFR